MTEVRPVLVVKSGGDSAVPEWRDAFAEYAPDIDVRGWNDDSVAPESVRYALVWEPEPGRLKRYTGLRLILSAAAGVDHILADPQLPSDIPIVRMVTSETAERMADYVTMAALGLVRQLPDLIEAQRLGTWRSELTGRLARETTVGIMGLGTLGLCAANKLAAVGFMVSGWTRSRKSSEQIRCFAGQDELSAFLSASDILVNLLPETAQTRGILDAQRLAELPRGAAVVNVGRGSHLDCDALLAALDERRLSGAVLDVFANEPLPASHPVWSHPKVIVTPHVASFVSKRARARQAANAITADLQGQSIPHLFDRALGY
jgi:glyoxylate/hydroxypyruvate reductase A